MSFREKFPCPCCGYLVFDLPPGSHHQCPICMWEDNLVQLRFPRMHGGANTVSLETAQQNFLSVGAAERRNADLARRPLELDRREEGWRLLDPVRDNIEEPQRGIGYADTYPEDNTTVLYYWRATYWRRYSS